MSQQLTGMGSPGMGGGMNPQGAMMSGGGGPDGMMSDMQGMGAMDCGSMGPMGGPGMNHQFNSMGPMGPMGPRSMSPKLGGQMSPFGGQGPGPGMRPMMRPQMGAGGGGMYNGANVQVKASAPNTIQYLPTRPQMGAPPNQRGPPSLEFLNRFAGPMGHNPMGPGPGDQRMHNMQYFPQQQFNQGGMDPTGGDMSEMGGGPGMPGMMGGGMMRPRPPMRMPMGGGPPFNPGPPNSNPFGPKMGMEGQPLPPSGPPMGGPGGMPSGMPGGFNKFGPGGPGGGGGGGIPNPNADPNYAQQYHTFQQQLYATNTRGQLSQQSFFGPK